MNEEVNDSLKKIAKGSLILLLSSIISAVLLFFIRILVVRNLSQEDFGIFSLIFTIINICVALSSLGLQHSIARFIAFHKIKKNPKKLIGSIKATLELSFFGSVLFFLIVFFGSNFLGKLFNNAGIIFPLKLFVIIIPFLAFIQIICSIYRGFNKVSTKVIFNDLLLQILTLVFVSVIFLMKYKFLWVIFSYISAAIITFLILIFYSYKNYFKFFKKYHFSPMKKSLFLFSFPLIFRLFLAKILTWSDIILLGYFKDEILVGIYNVGLSLVKNLPIFLTSITFLFVPLATQFFAKNDFEMLKKTYAIVTKWVFFLTSPVFLIFFLFPEGIISFLFGAEYITASTVLRILSFGFIWHSILGPNGSTFIVFGKTKILFWTALLTTIINVVLNIFLIPSFDIIGAAIASAISLITVNIFISIQLYRKFKVHPFEKNYIKSLLICGLCGGLILFLDSFIDINFWFFPLILVFYAFLLLISKSFNKEDFIFLLLIEKKLNLNLKYFKKIIKKFI